VTLHSHLQPLWPPHHRQHRPSPLGRGLRSVLLSEEVGYACVGSSEDTHTHVTQPTRGSSCLPSQLCQQTHIHSHPATMAVPSISPIRAKRGRSTPSSPHGKITRLRLHPEDCNGSPLRPGRGASNVYTSTQHTHTHTHQTKSSPIHNLQQFGAPPPTHSSHT
jgi:hypothetical protein